MKIIKLNNLRRVYYKVIYKVENLETCNVRNTRDHESSLSNSTLIFILRFILEIIPKQSTPCCTLQKLDIETHI